MFDTLVASQAARPSARGWGNGVLVVVLHAALIGAAVWATGRPSVAETPPIILDNDDWPPPAGPTPVGRPATPWSPGDPLDVALSDLPAIPELDVGPAAGVPVDAFARAGGGSSPVGDTSALLVTLVEERPELLSAPVPPYPDALRRLGVTGRVVVDVVVDTLGRVEPGSLRVVEAAHPGLVEPVRQSLGRALFRPARVHGRAVRVLVRIPFEFRIER